MGHLSQGPEKAWPVPPIHSPVPRTVIGCFKGAIPNGEEALITGRRLSLFGRANFDGGEYQLTLREANDMKIFIQVSTRLSYTSTALLVVGHLFWFVSSV